MTQPEPQVGERLRQLINGYQVTQAMIAEGSGGFEGKGYRKGTQIHKGFVYSQQSDFIFAASELLQVHLFIIGYAFE